MLNSPLRQASSRKRKHLHLVTALSVLVILSVEARAGRYPLGTRWLERRQGNVTVIVPRGWEEYGDYTMRRSLLHLDTLNEWYHQSPKHVSLILNPWQDAALDLATVEPMRVELTLTPVLDIGLRPQKGVFLDLVTAHELTHTVQFTTHAGITKPLRWMFGDAIAPLGMSPDWSLEGQAIWTESSEGGGRLHSSWHAQLLRTRLLENRPWSAAQIAFPGTVSPEANRAYIAGAFFYDDLVREHGGTDAAARWMKSRAAWPLVMSIPTRKVYGSGGVDLYRTFLRSWVDRWRRENPDRELEPRGRVLASAPRTGWRRTEWTPSGDLLAVERSYDHPTRLVRLKTGDTAVSAPETLAELGFSPHYGSTPFGAGAIVSEYRRGRWSSESAGVYLVRIDASGRHHELGDSPLRGFAPSWSEIAQQLAYVEKTPDGPHELRIATLDREGTVAGQPEILFRTDLGLIGEPNWSRDGSQLAFGYDIGEGERIGIWKSGSDSLTEIRIDGAANMMDPSFAEDGSLWLTADPDGVFDLFQIDLARGVAIRRTFTATAAIEPAPGPDGEVVYGHYTSEGVEPVLMTPDEMRADSTGFRLKRIALRDLQHEGPQLADQPETGYRRYSALRHSAPIFWLPMVNGGDENRVGLTMVGRDPLGLLSWRVTALQGLDSQRPDLTLSLGWQAWPVEISGQMSQAPTLQASYLYDPADSVYHYDGDRWRPETDGSVTFTLPVRLDGGGSYAEVDPWAGWVTRERGFGFAEQPTGFHWFRFRYHGIRAGVKYVRSRSAARDPVASHALSISLFGERNLSPSFSDLTASYVEARFRWHHPGVMNKTVIALTGAVQQQDYNWIEFSRAGVLPRGYSSSDLNADWIRTGRLAKAGVEAHFPILFPDWGWGMGAWYLERITGLFFVEGVTSWASVATHRPLVSVGGEIVARGMGLYKVPGSFRVGVAWREHDRTFKPYVSWSLPLSTITGVQREAVRDDDLTGYGAR